MYSDPLNTVFTDIRQSIRFRKDILTVVTEDDEQISRFVIVLVDTSTNVVLQPTTFHKYIVRYEKSYAKPIESNSEKKFDVIVKFLNYIYFESTNHISSLCHINMDLVKEYLSGYATGTLNENDKKRRKATILFTIDTIIKFLTAISCDRNIKGLNLKPADLMCEKERFSKRKMTFVKYKEANLNISYRTNDGEKKPTVRDLTFHGLSLILNIARQKYPLLYFVCVVALSTGLRIGEILNIPRVPGKNGIVFTYANGEVLKITINVFQEMPFSSGKVHAGIKKPRSQMVFPQLQSLFLDGYQFHMDFLTSGGINTRSLFVNKYGKPLTEPTLQSMWHHMIVNDVIPAFYSSNDPELNLLAKAISEAPFGMHIFRHMFSIIVALCVDDPAQLQFWRGDSSPESSITYLRNKTEYSKLIKNANSLSFDFHMAHGEAIYKATNEVALL